MLTEKSINGLFYAGKISAKERDSLISKLAAKPQKMADGGIIKPSGKVTDASPTDVEVSAQANGVATGPAAQAQVQSANDKPAEVTQPNTSAAVEPKDATIAAGNTLNLEQVKTAAAQNAVLDIQDAVAKVGYAKAVAKAYDDELLRQGMIEQEKERLVTEYAAKHEAIFESLKNQSIDPNRWWKNKSTGDKVMLGVATFLAGVGGGPNQVLAMIQNAVDADIRSQVADLQRAELMQKNSDSVFAAYQKLYNDKALASLATKEAMLRGVESKLVELELPLKNELQKLNLRKLRAEVEALRLQTSSQLKAAAAASPAVQSQLSVAEKVASIQDKGLRDIALKEYEVTKLFPTVRKQVQDAYRDAMEFSVKRATSKLPFVGKKPNEDDQLKTVLINAYETVTGNEIRQNEKAIDTVLGGYLPEPLDGADAIKEKMQKFEKFLVEQKNAKTKTLIDLGIISPEVDRSQFKKVR